MCEGGCSLFSPTDRQIAVPAGMQGRFVAVTFMIWPGPSNRSPRDGCGSMHPSRPRPRKASPAATLRASLLIVAHGERGGKRHNRLPNIIAERMRSSGRFQDVAIGYISDTPDLASAGARLKGDEVRIVPLFMSDGYYVRQAIPERLAISGDNDASGRRIVILAPTGLSARLPAIVAGEAASAARSAGLQPDSAHLLMVAHGSGNDPASRLAAEAAAAAVSALQVFGAVHTAFLEEPPLLAKALAALPGPLIVSGFFIGEGLHGAEDLGAAVAASGRGDVHLAPPLARSPAFIQLICDDIAAATAVTGRQP